MKTIIAGGRDFVPDILHAIILEEALQDWPITEVVCGMAKGADLWGKHWAEQKDIPVKEFPADWKKHGRVAGPIRNGLMADYADALIAFPGGAGTSNMIKVADAAGLKIKVVT